MSMYKCPVCGELFSTSYKKCPFCEEDDLMATDAHRRSSRRRRHRNEPRAVGPVLIVIFLLLAALVVFLVAGDSLFAGKEPAGEDDPPISGVTDPTGGEQQGDPATEPDQVTVPLALDRISATLEVGGSVTLTASGGSGTYSWSSSDEGIASVTEGVVKTIGAGSATITVSDGETQLTCAVTVTPVPLQINKTDVSIGVGESFTLKAEGGSNITFTSDNESVAVVGADGVVTGKGKGKANITASNGSASLSCIVRVVR